MSWIEVFSRFFVLLIRFIVSVMVLVTWLLIAVRLFVLGTITFILNSFGRMGVDVVGGELDVCVGVGVP